MLNVRLEDKHRNHLDRVAENRSEYIRNLIEEDIKHSDPKDPEMEYKRCQNDILHFVRQYAYRKDPREGTKKIQSLNKFQESVLHDLSQGENVIIKKGRRKRVTTTLQHYVLWKSLFHSGTTTCLSSYKLSRITRMKKDIINYGYSVLPEAFKCGFMRDTTEKTTFKNASSIVPRTKGVFAPDVLVVEEAGYMDEIPLDGHVDMRPDQTVITYTVQDKKGDGSVEEVEPNNEEKLEQLYTDPDYEPYSNVDMKISDGLTINADID